MSSGTYTLRIRSPTPSTVEYTVTTRPERYSSQFIILLVLKLIVFGLIALVILLKLDLKNESEVQNWTRRAFGLDGDVLADGVDDDTRYASRRRVVEAIGGKVHWSYLVLLGGLGVWIGSWRGYTEEQLLVLRGLGLQTSTSSPSHLLTPDIRFIPTSAIQDVFIHEGFVGFEVRFYLIIVVKDENDVVVVFPKLLPRREIVENVWRGTRRCLYEGMEKSAE